MNRICIKCGKDKELINEFCKDCFIEENSLLKHFKEIKIIICAKCNSYLYKNSWRNEEYQNLEKNIEIVSTKLLKEKIVLNPDVKLKNLEIKVDIPKNLKISNGNIVDVVLNLNVIGSIKDIDIKESYEIPIKIKFSICNNCKKLKGRYYEATLQIRPKNERVLKFVEDHCNNKKNVFISKIEEEKYGYDIFLSDQKEARSLGSLLKKKFGGEIKESKKLFGRKEGKDIYRGTVLFRLDNVR